jgi:hypothetical protein
VRLPRRQRHDHHAGGHPTARDGGALDMSAQRQRLEELRLRRG